MTDVHDPPPQATRRDTPLLTLRGVSKVFGAVQALTDVDLTVDTHQVVALVGDNAAGKSTLARVIAGVYAPDGGTIDFNGSPAPALTTAIARQLGIATVFQDLALSPNLDVTANIFMGQEVRRRGLLDENYMEGKAREFLHMLNSRIPSPRTPLGTLSAGQRQCVAIARTLVGDPRLIVLDEPTSSLSISQTAEVLQHIASLRSLGLGVIFISHSLTDIRAVADRIEVLRHGHNNGSFDAVEDAYEDVVAAITGAPAPSRRSR